MKLKTKLLLLNSGFLAFLGITLFLQFNAAQNKQKLEIRKNFENYSRNLGASISEVFYMYYHTAQNIALNSSIKNKKEDEARFYLNELVSLYPLYDLIVFVDTNGKFIASNDLNNSGKKLTVDSLKSHNFTADEWFKELKEGKLVEDYDKKIYGSYVGKTHEAAIVSDAYGSKRIGNFFATAVADEFGDPVGYLATFVNQQWVMNEIQSLQAQLEHSGINGVEIKLVDKDGVIIGTNGKEEVAKYNFVESNKDEIASIRTDYDRSFFQNMFAFDSTPLYAFSSVSSKKFVDSLGWKAFLKVGSEQAFSTISVASTIFSISFIVLLVITTGLAVMSGNKLASTLLSISDRITEEFHKLNSSSDTISNNSKILAGLTDDQAASLQETVASLNEIAAMVDRNTESSQKSKEVSSLSKKSAEAGKKNVEEMIKSIHQIAQANDKVVAQVEENNNEMKKIISVIKNIEDKTKVINDIVFQTKLLSFNASVEAARAGEHGKGFAVVAEEVGNLAESSGSAAREIEQMLIESVQKVEAIATKSQKNVESLVVEGKSSLEEGQKVATECDTSLQEILENTKSVNEIVETIANASIEQSKGIQEITQAMAQLDQVTQQNSQIAKESSASTVELKEQAGQVFKVASYLSEIILGAKGTSTKKEQKKVDKPSVDNIDEQSDAKVINFTAKASESPKSKPQPVETPFSEPSKEPVKMASNGSENPISEDDQEWEDI